MRANPAMPLIARQLRPSLHRQDRALRLVVQDRKLSVISSVLQLQVAATLANVYWQAWLSASVYFKPL